MRFINALGNVRAYLVARGRRWSHLREQEIHRGAGQRQGGSGCSSAGKVNSTLVGAYDGARDPEHQSPRKLDTFHFTRHKRLLRCSRYYGHVVEMAEDKATVGASVADDRARRRYTLRRVVNPFN